MQERTVHQKHAGANRRKKAEQAKEIDIKNENILNWMKRMKRISFEFLLNFLSVCFTLFIRHISRYTLHKSRKTSSKEPSKGAKTKLNRLLNRTISTTKDNTKNNKRTIQTTSRTAIFRIQDGNLSNSQYVYAFARILFLRAYIVIRALVRVCVCEESQTTVPIVPISIVNLNSTVLNLRFRGEKVKGDNEGQ